MRCALSDASCESIDAKLGSRVRLEPFASVSVSNAKRLLLNTVNYKDCQTSSSSSSLSLLLNKDRQTSSVSSLLLNRSKLSLIYLRRRFRRRCVAVGNHCCLAVGGQRVRYVVERIDFDGDDNESAEFARVSADTLIEFVFDDAGASERDESTATSRVNFSQIGGLQSAVKIVHETLRAALFEHERYARYRLDPPRGLLLYGPAGTGKTLIARAVATELDVTFVALSAPEIVGKHYGESEKNLRVAFERAARGAPAVVFIDEIDAVAPQRDSAASTELDRRVVSTLVELVDSMAPGVAIIAATNRIASIDSTLRRAGRLGTEIEIGVPARHDRRDIFDVLLRRCCPSHALGDADIEHVASVTHGYVGADLMSVCQHAVLSCYRRCRAASSGASSSSSLGDGGAQLLALAVSRADMDQALSEVGPSAMREVAIDVPAVRWHDIGGNEEIKQQLKEAVTWPLQHPEAFTRMGIRPPKGILLYGPPGCSKTLMAKALATEAGLNFLAVKGPELFSKWVGESERAVRQVFRRARAASPSIVFFDEIDALAVKRSSSSESSGVAERVLSQLLNELDGIQPLTNVTVVAATNRPDMLDDALLRPGRLDRKIYVAPPDVAARRQIFAIQLQRIPINNDDIDLDRLAALTDGFSGAEIVGACRQASLLAIRDNPDAQCIEARHLNAAIEQVQPAITMEMLAFYESLLS
jgi:AAA family ATPase